MNRMVPKPDLKQMLECIHNGSIGSLEHSILLAHCKKKITTVLHKNPQGINLEKFNTAFKEEFGEWLAPSMFGYSDVVEMLNALSDIVVLRQLGANSQVLLFPKPGETEGEKGSDNNKKSSPVTSMRDEVIDVFRSIITSLGGISVDVLIPEYEARTNQKLNLQKLGFNSFPDFLSHLTEVFKTFKREGKVILCDPATPNLGLLQDKREHTNTPPEGRSRGLDSKTTQNLRKLLEEEFPFGLLLDELYAAYEGFYGSSQQDLNYERLGYGSLEGLLAAHSDTLTLHHHSAGVCVLPCLAIQHPNPEQINLSHTGRVVGPSEAYTLVERLPPGKVQVVVGEVYTPKHFWVMHYGEQHSFQLDLMMDRMLDFYSGPLGNRYKLLDRQVTHQMVLAALYPLDQNFYRAFVLSVEDLTTVKLLFVDYGTVWVTTREHLRLLHQHFLRLPAQAIKCSLHGIVPAAGKRSWGRVCSSRLLVLVQNQRLTAQVVAEEMTSLIKLWDTSGGGEVSIADLLVSEGLVTVDEASNTAEPAASASVLGVEVDHRSHLGSTSCSLDLEVPLSDQEDLSQDPELLVGAAGGAHHPGAQLPGAQLPGASASTSALTLGEGKGDSLPRTRSAASSYDPSMLQCTPQERCSSDPNSEAAAAPAPPAPAGSRHFRSSTPIKEVVTVGCSPSLSNDSHIFVSDEELQDEEDEPGHSFLIQPIDLSFNKRLHILLIDGVQYVLNTDLPHLVNNKCHLGITITKETHEEVYSFMIENMDSIHEASGEVRASFTLYPLKDVAPLLHHSGYRVTCHHPAKEVKQKWRHKHQFPELVPVPDTSRGSSSGRSGSTGPCYRPRYKPGVQVEPLRRPCFSIQELGRHHPKQDTPHQVPADGREKCKIIVFCGTVNSS